MLALRIERTGRAHHTHGAAVHAARRAFQRVDHLHGAHLGCPGDGAAGEQRCKHVRERGAGPRARGHVRGHLPHGGQGLGGKKHGHAHAVGQRNARHIVAQQVHDHHVLGTLLGRRAQVRGLLRVLFGRGAARGRAFHGAGQDVAALGRVPPVKEQLGRDRQHLLAPGVDVRRIPTGLGAQQRGKQGRGRALQRAVQGGGVVDLVELARRNRLLDLRQRGVEGGAVGAVGPRHLRGRFCTLAVIARGPGQRRVVHRKPGQRAVGRVGQQRGIEGCSRLVAHEAHTPAALLCRHKHGIQHATHLVQRMGGQHLARRAKGVAQARRAGVQRLGEVNAGNHKQKKAPGA